MKKIGVIIVAALILISGPVSAELQTVEVGGELQIQGGYSPLSCPPIGRMTI